MFRSHLSVAFRILLRHPGYSAINVLGLAVGLASTLLILLFVADELGYDAFQEDADRIVRITADVLDESGASRLESVLVDPGWAPLIDDGLPGVEAVVRLTPVGPVLSIGDRKIACGDCYWVDADLFRVLTFDLVQGDPATALSEPSSLVLSRSRALALFGEVDVVGRSVTVNGDREVTVTGVFEDLPHDTHLPADGFGTLSSFAWFDPTAWRSPNYATYAKLAPGADPEALEAGLADLVARHRTPEDAARIRLGVQWIRDIHLHSHRVGELGVNGNASTVALLAAVALFILAIACINFMNLSTARSSLRAREVGVRKSTGAQRSQLVGQFLGESVLLASVALVVAAALVQLLLPAFNAFTGKDVTLLSAGAIAAVVGIGLATGVAAGSWPAFFLSSFRPAEALRGEKGNRSTGGRLRAALVVIQFTIAVVLAIGTMAVFRQLDFVGSRPLGYDRENVLVLPVMWDLMERFGPIEDRLLANPDIVSLSQSNPVPGGRLHTSIEAVVEDQAAGRLESASLYAVWADDGFLETYGIDLLAGRNFALEFASDADTGFLLNALAARRLGFDRPESAVGSPLRVGGWRGQVLGVVEDVHFESLHQPIAPQVYFMDPRNFRAVSVRIRPGADVAEVAAFLKREWALHDPSAIFSYTVLDDRLRQLYDGERRLGQLVGVFAGLALLVTCLGVFGLAAFAAERRTREIGIRKVFGAGVPSIVARLNRDILSLVGAAIVIGVPVGVTVAYRWLDTFAYSTGIPWWHLAAVAIGFVAIAAATVSIHAVRAATANPVRALRYE
jgi:putative ABC transport system permease protein